jgi:hypothetical protein
MNRFLLINIKKTLFLTYIAVVIKNFDAVSRKIFPSDLFIFGRKSYLCKKMLSLTFF